MFGITSGGWLSMWTMTFHLRAPNERRRAAHARSTVGTLAFGKTKVDQYSALATDVVEEVRGFDVSVENLMVVDSGECSEEGAEIDAHIGDSKVAKVLAEVGVTEVWQDCDDLVLMTESSDQGTDSIAASKIVEQFELVLNTVG